MCIFIAIVFSIRLIICAWKLQLGSCNCDNTCRCICVYMYVYTERPDQACILLVSCSYADLARIFIPQYVCQEMQRWHLAIGIFSVVMQQDYFLTEKYCASRRGQLIADLISLQQSSLSAWQAYLSLIFLLSNRIPLCFPIEQEALINY